MTYDPILEKKISDSVELIELLHAFRLGKFDKKCAVGFVNPYSYPFVSRERCVRDHFDLWFVDGGLLCRLSNLFRPSKLERVSFDFSSIADEVFSLCNLMQLRTGLIGGSAEEIENAQRYLEVRYPNIRFTFVSSDFFLDVDEDSLIDEMASQSLQVVIIGLGTPKQERFVLSLKKKLQAPALLFTCGGFLSQTGLSGDYYPLWVKRTGLRWLYRAFKHGHVRKRLFTDYPIFVIKYLTSAVWLTATNTRKK